MLNRRRLEHKAQNASELTVQETQASLPMTPKDPANTNDSSSSVDGKGAYSQSNVIAKEFDAASSEADETTDKINEMRAVFNQ